MVTVAEIVQRLVAQSPFISEALADGLVNVSALARRWQPEVERQLGKRVQPGAIVMAVNRMPFGELAYVEKDLRHFFSKIGDLSVRSNLVDYAFANSDTLMERQVALLELVGQSPKRFCTFAQGVGETTVIVTDNLATQVEELFQDEKLINKETDLASVTLMLPEENRTLYGVYYYILKQLAWHGINLIELISTSNEFTIVVQNQDVNQAFAILMAMRM